MSVPALDPDPLADLRVNYYKRLRIRVDNLKEFVRDYAAAEPISADAYSDYHRIVHSMISSSAIFGYMELSRAARVAEIAFEHNSTTPNQDLVVQVKNLIVTAAKVIDNVHIDEHLDEVEK